MPFGLKNAAQTYTVCRGLELVFVYTDNILVASLEEAAHKLHIGQLFECFRKHSVVINVGKCQFGQSSIDFLSHQITPNGAAPLPDMVKVVTNFKQPVTIKGLQEFVGMINFYYYFIPMAAQIISSTFFVLLGIARGPKHLVWTRDMLNAFQEAKAALAGAVMLTHPCGDASNEAVGAVLQQMHGAWRPLTFFSKQVRPTEKSTMLSITNFWLSI